MRQRVTADDMARWQEEELAIVLESNTRLKCGLYGEVLEGESLADAGGKCVTLLIYPS